MRKKIMCAHDSYFIYSSTISPFALVVSAVSLLYNEENNLNFSRYNYRYRK